ncbi:RluA family pseudouridine synthase [Candidatus Shapirobacteria bacterium]|nr:RluA family pseudouridine synthase [Candidatus Shapirobacteria bacterium]
MRKKEREVKFTPQILFEDESLLVVDKPAGMVVNKAETTEGETTLQDWISKNFQFPLAQDETLRNGIVHRLDKETSGLLMVAKNKSVFEDLQRQFKERKVQKKYLALVHGQVMPRQGTIEASISRSPFDRKKFGIFLGGRQAKTQYEVKSQYCLTKTGERFSLLTLFPQTGRTHQLRVHLKFINHPVVADEKYGGRKTARADRRWCPRQFLHAWGLSFVHPLSQERIDLSAKLPSDLQLAMMNLDEF